MNFLIRRHIAIGDVFLITCCIKGLKRKFPNCNIDVAVDLPELLRFNPNIRNIFPSNSNGTGDYDKVFNLINSYEYNPKTQIARCYLDKCELFDEQDTLGELWFNKKNFDYGTNFVNDNYIFIEASKNTHPQLKNRYFKHMNEVCLNLKNHGFKVAICGWNNGLDITNFDIDLTGKLTLFETISVISQHGISYSGYHGGMAHILQSIPVPTIIYYTVHRAEYTQTVNDLLKVINVKTDCFDCRSRLGNGHPSPWPSCYHPEIDCTETISVEEMTESIIEHSIKYKDQINERKFLINEIC